MLDGDLFDVLDHVGRRVRHVNKPFGGIQLVLAGDFLQLPPISDSSKSGGGASGGRQRGGAGAGAASGHSSDVKFCFESQAWNEAIYASVELRRVFRQRDMVFVTMLNELRVGIVSPATIRAIAGSGAEVEVLKRVRQ